MDQLSPQETPDKATLLRQILEAHPQDSFARYGLAMEYASRNDLDASLREFATLLADHPGYTPGYFMAAQTLVRAGRAQDARQRLEQGIASARREGNAHAEREMQAMLDELELELDR